MKRKLFLWTFALMITAGFAAPAANAIGLSIEVGDRPYYEGPEFWDWGWHYVWVRGHWGPGHHWIRGYYVRQGDWNSRHLHVRHHWQHHDHDHH